jgi:hypothetical protein
VGPEGLFENKICLSFSTAGERMLRPEKGN